MAFRKSKVPEQGRAGRQVQRSAPPGAFSYYSSRNSDTTTPRVVGRQEPKTTGEGRQFPRLPSQLSVWLMVAVVAACGLKILYVSSSAKIVILGKNSVSSSYVQPPTVYADAAHEILARSVTNHSKLTINLADTRRNLEKQFPEVQTASVALPLIGSRPIVYLQLAQPSVILQSTSGNYAVNASGLVLAKLSRTPSGVPLVVDQSGTHPRPGTQVLPSSTVAFVQTVSYQLSAEQINVNAYILPSANPYELDARIGDTAAYSVRFNLEADALKQSGVVVGVIRQLGGSTPAEYLDVRVPGRAYYK